MPCKHRDHLPYLDLEASGFSTRSSEVAVAREAEWCARTPYGLAVLRYREAGQLIRDRRLRQGSYAWPETTGLTGSFAEFWTRSLISMQGVRHRQVRSIAERALSRERVEGLVPAFKTIASELADGFTPDGENEFMDAFATPFASRAICALLGTEPGSWKQIAADASALGLSMGIGCKQHEKTINDACDRLMELARHLVRVVRQDSGQDTYVARLVDGFSQDQSLNEQCLLDLVVITIFGGVDTTRSQLGSAMVLFAENPEQWELIRKNPDLITNAIEETIRHRPATTWVTREALKSFEFGGVNIRRGETLHLLVHASALDPEITQIEGFDVQARRRTHFGFGGGAHHCLGHLVARTDIASALHVLTRRLRTIALRRPPQWLPETGNTGPVQVPLFCALDRS